MNLLTCEDVAFSYEGNLVLSEVNFQIEQGDYLIIVGENGAGKSTLMKGLLNLKKPCNGKIIMDPQLKQSEIGYVPQQSLVQRDFPASVLEVVRSGRLNSMKHRLFYNREDKEAVEQMMEKLGLMPLKKQCYGELSGGQQQRVLLARALVAAKKILVLDEPVSGLDPVVSKQFYEIISELNKKENYTIIMVSHDIHGMIEYGSHVLQLGQKQLFFGTSTEYKESQIGKRFLGGEVLC